MSSPAATLRLHASAAAWCGRGILVRGASGAGKSALVAGLLAAGAYLVADDLVRLDRRDGTLYARPVAETGLIELRHNGIFRVATMIEVPVSLCVELAAEIAGERLPASATVTIGGVDVPRLCLTGTAAAAVAQILIAVVARRAH